MDTPQTFPNPKRLGPDKCLTLIGMAGAGKSTLGRLLAEKLGWAHLDTDRLMESYYGERLQGLMDRFGVDDFLRAEELVVINLTLKRSIVSTGGSVVYSPRAVARLRELGPVVFLEIDRETFLQRVGPAADRGFARKPGKTLEDVFNERQPLYRAASDFTVSTGEESPGACVDMILHWLDT